MRYNQFGSNGGSNGTNIIGLIFAIIHLVTFFIEWKQRRDERRQMQVADTSGSTSHVRVRNGEYSYSSQDDHR